MFSSRLFKAASEDSSMQRVNVLCMMGVVAEFGTVDDGVQTRGE